jgi:RNA 3'-terminal phosphate cyclase (ATP)
VVQAIAELVNGTAEGLQEGSLELMFRPGRPTGGRRYHWDIGSAGSTTMLALAVLPVLAFACHPTSVEIRGGLFQDFAPSFYHLQYVMLPLFKRMGIEANMRMDRPGYVPRGEGHISLHVTPVTHGLRDAVLEDRGPVQRVWGIALASHLAARHVSQRMAESARALLRASGYDPEFDTQDDTSSVQPGAALAAFADCAGGARLGADRAGALRRPAEAIGRHVARQLMADLETGATLDRFAADQIIPFAALASWESRFSVPMITDHMQSGAWLARLFLGADVQMTERRLSVRGVGFTSRAESPTQDHASSG